MPTLSTHPTVENTCLRILREKGYALTAEGEVDDDRLVEPDSLAWRAERDGYAFHADNPIELLGLVAIYDHQKPKPKDASNPYWWTVEGADIRTELLERLAETSGA